jgi:hypothetical protein
VATSTWRAAARATRKVAASPPTRPSTEHRAVPVRESGADAIHPCAPPTLPFLVPFVCKWPLSRRAYVTHWTHRHPQTGRGTVSTQVSCPTRRPQPRPSPSHRPGHRVRGRGSHAIHRNEQTRQPHSLCSFSPLHEHWCVAFACGRALCERPDGKGAPPLCPGAAGQVPTGNQKVHPARSGCRRQTPVSRPRPHPPAPLSDDRAIESPAVSKAAFSNLRPHSARQRFYITTT